MRYGILGTLTVGTGEAVHTPTAPKQRTLLALLLAHANRSVSLNDIVAELWPGDPPASAATTVQTYVMQLRSRLGKAAGDAQRSRDMLVTKPMGYLIRVQAGELDVFEFERAEEAGLAAMELGDARGAVHHLRHSLSVWRGPALVDVRPGPALTVVAHRFNERRLHVEELWLEAELQLGRHREVIGELRALAGRHPLHEGFHAKLMLALYRANRRTDALDVYRQLRARLREHSNVDPGEAVRQLREAIEADSPALTTAGPSRHWRAGSARPRYAS